MIDVELSFSDIEEFLNFEGEKLYRQMAIAVHSKVIKLINQSRNVHGKKYQAYSNEYVKQRLKVGLSGKVNLQYGNRKGKSSTHMVQNISFKANEKGFEVYIRGSLNNKKARFLNDHKNWVFFEWGNELKQEIFKILAKM